MFASNSKWVKISLHLFFSSSSYVTLTHDPYLYELEQLASSDDKYRVRFQYILDFTLRISYVIQTHDPCLYKLEKPRLAMIQSLIRISIGVLFQRTDMFAGLL
jgi:hypothetical protein